MPQVIYSIEGIKSTAIPLKECRGLGLDCGDKGAQLQIVSRTATVAGLFGQLKMNETLGQLVRVELRNIWTSESVDFTPWLARRENIALLGVRIPMISPGCTDMISPRIPR